ncbi:IPT/TIG domain-containing protein [Sphingobacterium sp. xlx-130]|uniref:IPT/TIG domain-containing protein n=1 Tax=Sphingobacterium sp. xlx-130 TaxID=2654323 RepID=UPI001969CD90|nr:IPT/TIG domain-containing protein [Sphingobacterium sp. xlx-130]
MLRLFSYLCFTALFILGACKKVENHLEPVETKPITFEVPTLEEVSKEGFKITCQVLSLNSEPVEDYGFVVYTASGSGKKEEKISLGKNLKVENIQHHYKPSGGFVSGENYMVYFYAQTNKGYYRSFNVPFKINANINATVVTITAQADERITVIGDFKEVNDQFRLNYSYGGQSVEYEISADKKSLTFNVPRTTFAHGSNVDFYLARNITMPDYGGNYYNERYPIAKIKLLATIDPISQDQVFANSTITLTGQNLPNQYDSSTDLMLIIGTQKVPYRNPLVLSAIEGLIGTEFKVGYSSGTKEVMLPNPLKLFVPNGEDITFSKQVIHPRSTLRVQGIKFSQYFTYSQLVPQLAGVTMPLTNFYNDYFDINVPDLPNGQYPLTLKSSFYSALESKNKVEVRKLVLNSVDKPSVYIGEDITIRGSFIDGETYTLQVDNTTSSIQKAQNGAITFAAPSVVAGKRTVKVGYLGTNGYHSQFAENNLSLTIEKSLISDVSPLEAYVGDVITVKGKGLGPVNNVMFGGTSINVINRSTEGFKFMIPAYITKGKFRVTVQIGDDYIQSENAIEIK